MSDESHAIECNTCYDMLDVCDDQYCTEDDDHPSDDGRICRECYEAWKAKQP